MEHRKAEIEAELKMRLPEDEVEILPNLLELYRRKVAALRDLLSDDNARTEAFTIIRTLIERIEVHPGEKRGECDVVLVGALAAILDFVHQIRTAAPCGDGGTFLMVAGVGFVVAALRPLRRCAPRAEPLQNSLLVCFARFTIRATLTNKKAPAWGAVLLVAGARNRRYLHLNYAPI